MDDLFGLTGKELVYYKIQVGASGQWEVLGMNRPEALEHIKKFCSYLEPEDFSPTGFTEYMSTKCQDVLLGNSTLPDKFFLKLPPFDGEGRSNLEYLLTTWHADGIDALENSFEQVFGYPWEPVPLSEYLAMEPTTLDWRRSAHRKYGTVFAANRVIDQYGHNGLSVKSTDEFLELVEIRLNRRGLTQGELHDVLMTTLTCDGGLSTGINAAECAEILAIFSRQARDSGNLKQFIDDTFFFAQRALMAHRKDDFEYIQLEPPFSDNALAHMHEVVYAFEDGREQGNLVVKKIRDTKASLNGDGPIVRIVGGDGLSMETAIMFTATDIDKRTRAEYWYVNFLFGCENESWSRAGHMSVPSAGGELISVWSVLLDDDKSSRIHFSTAGTRYKE